MKAVDRNRRSVLHYLVNQPPRGSYDNYKLLIQLVSAGAPPLSQCPDLLELALSQNLDHISTAFQFLLNKNCKLFVSPS